MVVVDHVDAYQILLLATALAMGRPVLATDEACYRDYVDVGANGWLIPGEDTTALVQAMTSILKRPDLLPGMARAARHKAERRLDQKIALKVLLEALGLQDLRAKAA